MATALAGAVTMGLGTVCLAAVGAAPMFGLAAAEQVQTMQGVTEVQMIDRVVVVRSSSTVPVDPAVVQLIAPATDPVIGPTPPANRAAPAGPTAAAPVDTWPAAPAPAQSTNAPPDAAAPATPAPVTTAKSTTTAASVTPAPVTTAKPVVTVAPTTTKAPTTTLPPGVPRDWPAGKPIPPMPPNCEDPQLELNGVWNCDD